MVVVSIALTSGTVGVYGYNRDAATVTGYTRPGVNDAIESCWRTLYAFHRVSSCAGNRRYLPATRYFSIRAFCAHTSQYKCASCEHPDIKITDGTAMVSRNRASVTVQVPQEL
ncbi:PREDICTED: uncharacterized protein LOC106744708 isoform X2 [Dinoponera quadriceps]|uniref:Uncharacterized protein LOC106744708 isoform X2 n=1 Tax=Dinoponera quadriceps TaxID=609295 RepID=A0A6P3XA73_DINQU|nr:PREDICTED: uncharacterized protein LOC106744708 isoform X2 [Dinoponera quadriceps]XP_014475163.1 PREDICTED: uncharacterized protein LOC106744708 isoform X2 [Dinoponera quadriceps]